MGNPICPKHNVLMKGKVLSVIDPVTEEVVGKAKYWVCLYGCKYRRGSEVIEK